MTIEANPEGCEEQSDWAIGPIMYVPCNKLATKLVYHSRDKRTYRMCEQHAWHNIKNRGGEDKGEFNESNAD